MTGIGLFGSNYLGFLEYILGPVHTKAIFDKVILLFYHLEILPQILSKLFVSCVACNFSQAIFPSDKNYVKTHVPDKFLVKNIV